MGDASIPELAQAMMLEWSDEALADLDRFAEFLSQKHPSLAPVVAREIVDRYRCCASTRSSEDHLPVAKNIARSCYRSWARLTCFNIATTVGVL